MPTWLTCAAFTKPGGCVNDNLTAFLLMLRACEGTNEASGYAALFGYTHSNDRTFHNGFSMHPNIRYPFTQTDGQTNYSTAAGAYQFLFSTWERLRLKLNLPDFGPASQDAAATELIAEAGAMGDVKDGHLQDAIDKCCGTWASLPGSKYPQPTRSYKFASNVYALSGGSLA